MDVTEIHGMNRAWLGKHRRYCDTVICVSRSLVGSCDGLAMSAEITVGELIGVLFPLRMEIDLDPFDMMLGCIWMGNLFADCHRNLELLSAFYRIGAFDYGHMFFFLPILRLKQFSQFLHWHSPFYVEAAYNQYGSVCHKKRVALLWIQQ